MKKTYINWKINFYVSKKLTGDEPCFKKRDSFTEQFLLDNHSCGRRSVICLLGYFDIDTELNSREFYSITSPSGRVLSQGHFSSLEHDFSKELQSKIGKHINSDPEIAKTFCNHIDASSMILDPSDIEHSFPRLIMNIGDNEFWVDEPPENYLWREFLSYSRPRNKFSALDSVSEVIEALKKRKVLPMEDWEYSALCR
jgi:hypothetical protein